MYIKQLFIKRFRGIHLLAWSPRKGVNCLVGPGDSCKTTVLDAIDLLFAERYNITFDDLDFYEGDTSHPIEIKAVLAELPREFLRDDRYGLHLSGWSSGAPDKQWREEPNEAEGIEPVLAVELVVDKSLEPDWHIVTRRNDVIDRSKRISFEDRKVLSPARVGGYSNRHLSWGRGSALQRVGPSPEELPITLSRLIRSARKSFTQEGAGAFSEPLETISGEIEKLGVQFQKGLVANLDFASISMGAGGVALHDGEIPVRCMGTGSSRLAVAALQSSDSGAKQCFLVDELEYGLEPHRISLLVSHLRNKVASGGQVFITTHSPTVLKELRLPEVSVCRRDGKDGRLRIRQASKAETATNDERRYTRYQGEALLSTKILVCEGHTEVGLMKGWASTLPLDFQSLGVAAVDGGGDTAAFSAAIHYAESGYKVALLTDSDNRPAPKTIEELKKNKVEHFEWGNGRCTEQELFQGVQSVELRKALLKTLLSDDGFPVKAGCGQLNGAFKTNFPELSDIFPYLSDTNNAGVIGLKANTEKWMKKNFDLCFSIGRTYLPDVLAQADGTLAATLEELHSWLFEDA